MSHPSVCFICNASLADGGQIRLVKQKGINTLIARSKLKGDDKWQSLKQLTEVQVHEKCRVKYSLTKKVICTEAPSPVTEDQLFDFKTNCFLCGNTCDGKHQPQRLVLTIQIQENIEKYIESREDEWARSVKERIRTTSLKGAEAWYHTACYEKFRYITSANVVGRPKISDLESAFGNVCRYMEKSEDCQFSMKELMDKLEGYSTSTQTLKQKLLNKYGSDIVIIESPGKPNVVCFRNTGYKILMNSWYDQKAKTVAAARLRVVSAAADIIREDIRSRFYDTSSYPSPEELLNNVEDDIPESLQCFLDKVLLKGKINKDDKLTIKRDSIAHSIISVVRPRSFISPIQLATGVFFTRKFGSRLIIDVLHSLGFSTSYSSISLYEASAVLNSDKKIKENAYVQYVFDNADHNVSSLDGLNTFHSMGGIRCVTPKSALSHQGKIQKLAHIPKAAELASKVNVPIVYCDRLNGNQRGLKLITFSDVADLKLGQRAKLPTAYSLHIWAKLLNIDNIASWRGYMETISHDPQYNVSQVVCLPFVNLPPSNVDTINTVLHSAATDCLRLNQKTCFVTFDQPLYIKAREIVANNTHILSDVIVRLGGFHLLMSFFGAVGTIMDGSGLKELLSTAYAGNTVDHMLMGYAFSRAIRGHLIVHTALGSIIARHTNHVEDEDRLYITEVLKDFAIQPPTLHEINNNEKLIRITTKMLEAMENLANVGRTARLWLQYFNCITLVMQFIEAERLGNWQLHLQCVRDMLPFFHAADHLAYAKSAQIYLQDMSELPSAMTPKEYDKFTTQGHFTIRRSDKKWAGIWTDMTVEQTLMRAMKISGGLTHGRGINKEGVIARWILGMSVAYEVIEGFETFCGVRSASGEQHTDLRTTKLIETQQTILNL